jgi:5-carboxymethyl-2-hydroxymuconate isomerase
MPHFTIEYSANLERDTDIGQLCQRILQAALDTGVFETGAVRVRAVRCDHFAIADQLDQNAFADVSLRMGEGRPMELRKKIGDAIYAALTGFFSTRLASPHFALSFEIREINADLSWKTNAIHPRLRSSA